MGSGHNKNTVSSQHDQIQQHNEMLHKAGTQLATFGAGCFWGTEKFFRKQFNDGLASAAVGYMGGKVQNPSYEVCYITRLYNVYGNYITSRLLTTSYFINA